MGCLHGCCDKKLSAASGRRGWVEWNLPTHRKILGREPRIKSHHGRTASVIRQDNCGGWSISRQGPSPQVSLSMASKLEADVMKRNPACSIIATLLQRCE